MSYSSYSGCAKEIKSLRAEIKRLNQTTKKLKEQRKKVDKVLRDFMIREGLEVYEDITLKSVNKKELRRKKKMEKESAAITLLYENGVQNAETVWETLKASQRSVPIEEENPEDPQPQFYNF